jgi:glycosyltransferase involved in cell wall biosynthesis
VEGNIKMKIAINCIYFNDRAGGIKEYIYNLVRNLVRLDEENDYVFYVTREYKESFNAITAGKGKIKIFPFNSGQKIRRSLFQQRFWYNEEQIENFDIFHSPFFYAPKFKNAKIAITVHDLRFLKYPSTYALFRYVYLKFVVKDSIKRAHFIIAISNFTKNEIIRYYKITDQKIKVIHEAVDSTGFLNGSTSETFEKNGVILKRKDFFISVGFLEPRKNYQLLIKAYSKLPGTINNNLKLVIVGKKEHGYQKTIRAIKRARNVIYLNYVSRKELSWLYKNSLIHIFPSLYEGFGFPSLEAGLFGVPTVGANQSSIPEISGKGGIYFDPLSDDALMEALIKLLTDKDLYSELSKEALKNIEKFSWEKNARMTVGLYNGLK